MLELLFLVSTFAPACALIAFARGGLITRTGAAAGLIAQVAALAWMLSDITGSSSSTAAIGFLAVPPVLFVLAVATVVIDALARVVRRIVRPPKPPSLAPGSGDDWSGLPPRG